MLDLYARQIVVSSALYYGLDETMMPDAEYDKISAYVAEHFDELDPIRKWQLESAEAIRATGNHVKVTQNAIGCACMWIERNRGIDVTPVIRRTRQWRHNKDFHVDWLLATEFVRAY